jgi:osmotically-inducible protein OsmY
MKSLKILAATALALPAVAMAQTVYVEKPATSVRSSDPYYVERITVYDNPRYSSFVDRENGGLQSGGASLDDVMLADSVAMALARDRKMDGAVATVSASNGRVSVTGFGDQDQSNRALNIAARVAGFRNVSGALSNDGS